MASISIKNIGPIKDTGVVTLAKFNIVIGKQSTGKSTFMKIVCFCQWLEKKIMSGNDKELVATYTHYLRFLKELKRFHRFDDSFFNETSEIHYSGECVNIDLVGNKKNVRITRLLHFERLRHNTKLSFIPSERNLVSAVKNVDRAYRSNDDDVLFNHVFEWGEAKEITSENRPVDLSVVGDMEYYYDTAKYGDTIRLRATNQKLSPFYASSGVQSVLPIVVMTEYLTETIFSNKVDLSRRDITELFRRIMNSNSSKEDNLTDIVGRVSNISNYQNTKLFIEEPEQNLFPESQQQLVELIVKRVNHASNITDTPSSLMLTTHSPYIVTAFNVLLKASEARKKDEIETNCIVDSETTISIDDIQAYMCKDGTLSSILDHELGMISGVDLDHASDIVENKLIRLNNVIYGD